MVSEFIGTMFFLLFAYMAANESNLNSPPTGQNTSTALTNTNNLFFTASVFGASIAVNIFIFGHSGGLFNPAVTLAFLLIGKLKPMRALLLFIAQILAGITAAGLAFGFVDRGLYIRCTLGGGISVAKGFFIETFFTAELILTVLFMAVEKHEANHIAPVAIGLAIFIAHMGSIYYTGTGINPARTFGPNVVLATFNSYDMDLLDWAFFRIISHCWVLRILESLQI